MKRKWCRLEDALWYHTAGTLYHILVVLTIAMLNNTRESDLIAAQELYDIASYCVAVVCYRRKAWWVPVDIYISAIV